MVASRYGSATWPLTPVTPSRIRSPASDCGEPAKNFARSLQVADLPVGRRLVERARVGAHEHPGDGAGDEAEVEVPRA